MIFGMTPVVCLSVCLEVSSGVPVVIDVPYSPPFSSTLSPLPSPSPSLSLVVMSEALLSDFDWETVEPQSFSFSGKRQAFFCGE